MAETTYYDIVIVGAGPAGLSLAYYLQKDGIKYAVVDENSVGYSWSKMPKNWRVVSPQWTNILPGTKFPFLSALSKPRVNRYRDYLLEYVEYNSLNVIEGTAIERVAIKKSSRGFVLHSQDKLFGCRILVSATGYFTNPFVPKLPNGNDRTIPSQHVAHYSCPEELKNQYPHCEKILIVGRRVSAGQLMTELVYHGFSVTISARGPICPRDGSVKGKIKDNIYFPYEELKVRFNPRIHADSFPHMDGGKTEEILNENVVETRPNLTSIKNRRVIFEDGSSDSYDLILFATGYKPTLEYLKDIIEIKNEAGLPDTKDMESLHIDNLFFIGLDQIYDFRSRYLRGIRKDARVLYSKISDVLIS